MGGSTEVISTLWNSEICQKLLSFLPQLILFFLLDFALQAFIGKVYGINRFLF